MLYLVFTEFILKVLSFYFVLTPLLDGSPIIDLDILPDFGLPNMIGPIGSELTKIMEPLGGDLSRMMEGDLGNIMGPLGSVLQTATGGTGAAGGGTGGAGGGAGAGGTGAIGTGTVPVVTGTVPVVTSPTAPAMMAAIMPGIGIGLLAGAFIAEILVKKNKKHPSPGYNYDHQPYGFDDSYDYGYGYKRVFQN